MVRTVCILILLGSLPVFAQTGKHVNPQKFTEVEIKAAERIFATFKKRLEDTNDIRIALRGISGRNWFNRMVKADVSGLDQLIPRNNSLVLRNINVYRQFYLNLLTVSRIIGLHTATFSKGSDDNSNEMSRGALATVLRKVPAKAKKSIKFSWATIEGDLKFNTNLKKVIQATRMFDTAIDLVGKDLRRLKRERPSDYQNALQQINVYNDAPSVETCDDDGFYGLRKGTNFLQKIEGGYWLTVGRVNNRIGILAVEILSQ